MIKPDIKSEGRAHKDKYSLKNLLDIALIKELYQFGFEPSQIKNIIQPFRDNPEVPEEYKDVWSYFKTGREEESEWLDEEDSYLVPGYEKAGCLLLIYKEGEEYFLHIGNNDKVLNHIKEENLKSEERGASRSMLIVNLLKIAKELEEDTGEKL